MVEIRRPLGVTIIAILLIIGSIIATILVITLQSLLRNINVDYLLSDPVLKLYLFYMIIMIPISFILAVGLLKGIDLARFFTIILYSISVIASLISHNIFSIFIPLLIIFYLTRPHVKDFFYGIKSPIY